MQYSYEMFRCTQRQLGYKFKGKLASSKIDIGGSFIFLEKENILFHMKVVFKFPVSWLGSCLPLSAWFGSSANLPYSRFTSKSLTCNSQLYLLGNQVPPALTWFLGLRTGWNDLGLAFKKIK